MNISNTYLAFVENETLIFVSVANILHAGIPIYGDGKFEGEEMDMHSGDFYAKNEKGEYVKI